MLYRKNWAKRIGFCSNNSWSWMRHCASWQTAAASRYNIKHIRSDSTSIATVKEKCMMGMKMQDGYSFFSEFMDVKYNVQLLLQNSISWNTIYILRMCNNDRVLGCDSDDRSWKRWSWIFFIIFFWLVKAALLGGTLSSDCLACHSMQSKI